MFAGGAGGHGPEAGRASIECGAGEAADVFVVDEGDFVVELCFHGVLCYLEKLIFRPEQWMMPSAALRAICKWCRPVGLRNRKESACVRNWRGCL